MSQGTALHPPTLFDGLINGLGGIVGGGIFLLVGSLVEDNRQYAFISFVIAAIMCIMVSFCFSVLSKEYPSDYGLLNYASNLYENKYVSNTINGIICFGYIALLCVYSLSAGAYVADYFNVSYLSRILASIVVTVSLLLNYLPKEYFDKMQTSLVIYKMVLLLLVAFYGIYMPAKIKQKPKVIEGNSLYDNIIHGIISAIAIFVTYEGFEMNSRFSEDMVNPEINMPLSYLLPVLISAVLYVLITISVNKHIGGEITKVNGKSALIDLVKSYGFVLWGPIIIILTNLVANLTANLATIQLNEGIFEKYLRDLNVSESTYNFLTKPIIINKISKSMILWVTTILAVLIMLFGPVEKIKHIGSLLFLIIFGLVSMMAYRLIYNKEDFNEEIRIMHFKIPHSLGKLISFTSLILCIIGTILLLKELLKEIF